MSLRKQADVADTAAEPPPLRSTWIEQWPAVMILVGVVATLFWTVLFFWFAWAVVRWLIG